MVREISRRLVGSIEVVTLADAFGNIHKVQHSLVVMTDDEAEIARLHAGMDATIAREIAAMQARECALIRMARLRNHPLPAEVNSQNLRDCGCGQ